MSLKKKPISFLILLLIRQQLSTKKTRKDERLFTFDDLLIEAEERIVKDPEFTKAIQNLYGAALIDEFQDTDPIQYSIFKHLFLDDPEGSKPVIFVGDPKQSIYRFRNASLETYLLAKRNQQPLPVSEELSFNAGNHRRS